MPQLPHYRISRTLTLRVLLVIVIIFLARDEIIVSLAGNACHSFPHLARAGFRFLINVISLSLI